MTTYPSPDNVAEPAYSMLRRTSVVMTTIGASPLTVLSPVSRPTLAAPCRATRSEYFWLDSALMGVV
jgi:hypothetical protein